MEERERIGAGGTGLRLLQEGVSERELLFQLLERGSRGCGGVITVGALLKSENFDGEREKNPETNRKKQVIE